MHIKRNSSRRTLTNPKIIGEINKTEENLDSVLRNGLIDLLSK